MKSLCLAIGALFFLVCFNGCARNQAKVNNAGMMKKRKTFAESQRDILAELSKPPIRLTVAGRQEKARMEKDNSLIETGYDAFGNRTESRIFYNNSLLKMVILQTSADGRQQQALIYGQNGEVRTAPADALDSLLTAVPDEIAKAVAIVEKPKEPEFLLAQTAPAETPPTINFAVNNFNAPIVEKPVPVEAVKEVAEVAPLPVPTPLPVKSETKTNETEESNGKLRTVVQFLQADRRSTLVKKTN